MGQRSRMRRYPRSLVGDGAAHYLPNDDAVGHEKPPAIIYPGQPNMGLTVQGNSGPDTNGPHSPPPSTFPPTSPGGVGKPGGPYQTPPFNPGGRK